MHSSVASGLSLYAMQSFSENLLRHMFYMNQVVTWLDDICGPIFVKYRGYTDTGNITVDLLSDTFEPLLI